MTEPIENASSSIKQQLDNAASTPYPAWLLSTTLLYKGITYHNPINSVQGSSGGSYKFSQNLSSAKPTRASCLTFGLTNLLGGWIIYDGDVINGSGFTFAWSTLYLIVNGRSSFKSVFRGRVSPLALSLLAVGNAGIYGKKFFWPSS